MTTTNTTTSPVKPIPEGYHTLTPYITVERAAEAIEFYGRVFGAEVSSRFDGPNGTVMHADLRIGDSVLMLSDEVPGMELYAPKHWGGRSSSSMLYFADVDAVFARAIAAGALQIAPLENHFHGDRMGVFICPFGHRWAVAKHLEDVAPAEIDRRMKEWMAAEAAKKPAADAAKQPA